MTDTLMFAVVQTATFDGSKVLSKASGFFFQRDERLYLVTSRHVLWDEPSAHRPDRLEIELHVDATNLTRSSVFSMLLYQDRRANWRQGVDVGGEVDVAVIEIDRAALPSAVVLQTFTPAHLQTPLSAVGIGAAVLVVGFPLGFHDTLHHLPVARQATVASSFGVRFQGQGCFLTDARTHRGTSGAPVVMRAEPADAALGALPWKLLGIHAGSLDMSTRDARQDESLGLNYAWYADILLALTNPPER